MFLLHPFLVHFPVALLTVGTIADVIAYLRGKHGGSDVGWWNGVAGSCGLLASAASGLLAKENAGLLAVGGATALADHEQLAFATTVAFLLLTGWRLSHHRQIPPSSPRLFLFLSGAAIVLLWFTAHIGGGLVHEFGIGIIPAPRP
jgi:uncharacterized membrane protein